MNDKEIRPTLELDRVDNLPRLLSEMGYKVKEVLDFNEMRVLHHMERYWLICHLFKNQPINSLLDVGCGKALGIREIFNKLPQLREIVGIERADGVYQEVVDTLYRDGTQVNVLPIAAERSYLHGHFDVVSCYEVLGDEHVPNDNDLMGMLYRYSSKHIFLSCPNYRDRARKSYLKRVYTFEEFAAMCENNFPGCKLTYYGQLHPVNREKPADIGIFPWDERSDFLICYAEKL